VTLEIRVKAPTIDVLRKKPPPLKKPEPWGAAWSADDTF
jgi:hypothetical protein